jgi:hypothetical protein
MCKDRGAPTPLWSFRGSRCLSKEKREMIMKDMKEMGNDSAHPQDSPKAKKDHMRLHIQETLKKSESSQLSEKSAISHQVQSLPEASSSTDEQHLLHQPHGEYMQERLDGLKNLYEFDYDILLEYR